MATYEVGQTITWGLKTYDSAGTLTDVGTGPTATVTKPDATTASASVTKVTTGTYTATYSASAAGRWKVVWSGTGAASGGLPYTDVADVYDYSRLIIPLADARAALNLPAGTIANDDEIRSYIAAATEVIESIAGPVLPATKVQTIDGDGTTALWLYAYPTAITSVVEDGVTLAASTYGVGLGGILWRRTGAWSDAYPGNIVVTYTVGSTTITPNVLLAAREQVRFLWQMGQQGARPNLGTATAGGIGYSTAAGYAVPNRVIELLGGHVGANQSLGF